MITDPVMFRGCAPEQEMILIAHLFQPVSGSFPAFARRLKYTRADSPSSQQVDGLLGKTILRSQIENPAHRLDDKGRLIGCSSVQQHCHRSLEHLFYDATTKRFHNILLVRAQIAEASAHAMNFTAAHGFKTLS
jgi:hypothetical protein